MANVLVGQTQNFKIWYDPTLLPTNPEVVANATTLMSTVERDFATLSAWFADSGHFGPGNRINVNLASSALKSPGDNYGYKSNGTTQIDLWGAPPWSPVPAVQRMLFVAELAEVFMSCTPTGWSRGNSLGEGLSRFLAYLLSPAGYIAVSGTSDVNAWMNSPRSGQYILGSVGDDTLQIAYGAALLYLFYLNSQRNYPVPAIIRAGSNTLAELYQKLGGQGDGFSDFLALLNDFFPPNQPGDPTSGSLKVVNPFPLLYGGVGHNVVVTGTDQANGNPIKLNTGEEFVAPFFTCPKKLYHWTTYGQPIQISLKATAHGFGQAKFLWLLNGTPLVPGGDPNVTVTYTGPDIPGGLQTENTAINFSGQEYPAGDRLNDGMVLNINDPYGDYEATVECIATEMYAVAPDESGSWIASIADRELEWDAQYYRDQQTCSASVRRIIDRYVHVHVPFLVALTLPDPPPEYGRAAQLLKSAGDAMKAIQHVPAHERRVLEKLVEYRLGISAEALRGLARGRHEENASATTA